MLCFLVFANILIYILFSKNSILVFICKRFWTLDNSFFFNDIIFEITYNSASNDQRYACGIYLEFHPIIIISYIAYTIDL